MQDVNLHDLINQPGAGNHIPALVASGHWDEYAGLPKSVYDVQVNGSVSHCQTYKITARHPDEAESLVVKVCKDDFDSIDDIDVKPMEPKECN